MSNTPAFLVLPPSIRVQIYVLAGLVRSCPVNINKESSRKAFREERMESYRQDYAGEYEHLDMEFARQINCDYEKKKYLVDTLHGGLTDGECICPPFPMQLLAVCRATYEEASDVLYSQNKFKVLLGKTVKLDPKAIAKMTSLSIRLNMCSCLLGHLCNEPMNDHCHNCHAMCRRGRDMPLSRNSDMFEDVIGEWTQACKILQSAVRPDMRLNIICDCADVETAQMIAEPLRSLPKVTECSIRLGQSPAMEWRQLAEETALLLTGRPLVSPFRFSDLPKELQKEILSHTELVSPYILQGSSDLYTEDCAQATFIPFEKGDVDCCLQCTDAAEACCCSVNHAAFSTTQCKCWSFPAALFNVSREMKREATAIFFSRNRFVIYQDPLSLSPWPGRNALSLLRNLPPGSLKYMRWIRFHTTDIDLHVQEERTVLDLWKTMAQFVEQHCEPSMLTIELDFLYDNELPNVYDLEGMVKRETTWRLYQNMVGAFQFHSGLRDFFVHLASPYDLSEDGQADLSLVRRSRATMLEKRIMGEDYDSQVRGKYTNRGLSLRDEVYFRLFGELPSRQGT
ncbi:hypothetical protein CVT26_009074 [Gymnopilus dilepis]|uniref:Uncharacterized protein n=1 Tax=Gymnopilus dilepis TaxID=231916 RepID=A0A409YB29_9AGAR|nr:hypothetical protein CVT26_009074 [Gymnopilus dilepis]